MIGMTRPPVKVVVVVVEWICTGPWVVLTESTEESRKKIAHFSLLRAVPSG